MMKKIAVLFLFAIVVSSVFAGCSDNNNSEIVGKWIPSTVSIGGSSVPYSEIANEEKEFCITFESSGKCTLVLGGIKNEGNYVFNETSVDIEYGGKQLKLDYSGEIITLTLNYNNESTSYMFSKVSE